MAIDRDYNDMSRDELLMLIGIEDDPALSHDDLLRMARERDPDM